MYRIILQSQAEAARSLSRYLLSEVLRSSSCRFNTSAIKHLDLNIDVDFDTEVISGKATYTIENHNANQIILDTKFLEIDKVEADGKPTTFKLGEFNEQFGQALTIDITNSTKKICFYLIFDSNLFSDMLI